MLSCSGNSRRPLEPSLVACTNCIPQYPKVEGDAPHLEPSPHNDRAPADSQLNPRQHGH